MKQKFFFVFLLLCIISLASFAQPKTTSAPPTADTSKPKKPAAGITDKVKSSKKMEGLFTLYQDTATGSVQLFVKKDQLVKNLSTRAFLSAGLPLCS